MEKNALPMMSFSQSVATCFKKYVCFKGRARRSEYWWFWILPYVVSAGCSYLFKWKLDQRSELESQISFHLCFGHSDATPVVAFTGRTDPSFARHRP